MAKETKTTKKATTKKETLEVFKVDVKSKEPIKKTNATIEEISSSENIFSVTSLHEAKSYAHNKLNEIKHKMSHHDFMDVYYLISGTKH